MKGSFEMEDLKINPAVYIQQMCMSAAVCESWAGDGDHLNILMAIHKT